MLFMRTRSAVEMYSKMRLRKEEDKLIASSAIAEMMSSEIRGRYIAGMWEKYLASQVLWRVDPKYENGCFSYPSKRPKPENYRAPSFSWVAADAPQGIKCGKTRRGNLLISVGGIHVTTKCQNPFGLAEESSDLELVCVMKRIKIRSVKKLGTTHYVWNLAVRERQAGNTTTCIWIVPMATSRTYKLLMGSYTVYGGKI